MTALKGFVDGLALGVSVLAILISREMARRNHDGPERRERAE